MLEITIPEQTKFNEETNEFVQIKETTLKLEHSLLSIKKWEAKWHVPFLGKKEKTLEEYLSYISCMTLNREKVDPNVYKCISQKSFLEIIDYVKDSMTATWFNNNNRIGASNRSNEVVTAETIYYWMISYRVPVEFEKWHLNQLLTLLKMIHIKSGGEKKMPAKEAAAFRKKLNQERRAKYKTKG